MKDNRTIIFGGVRSYGKSIQQQLMQNMRILKEWPSGTIATISANGTRYSELADAEEIKDQVMDWRSILQSNFKKLADSYRQKATEHGMSQEDIDWVIRMTATSCNNAVRTNRSLHRVNIVKTMKVYHNIMTKIKNTQIVLGFEYEALILDAGNGRIRLMSFNDLFEMKSDDELVKQNKM